MNDPKRIRLKHEDGTVVVIELPAPVTTVSQCLAAFSELGFEFERDPAMMDRLTKRRQDEAPLYDQLAGKGGS